MAYTTYLQLTNALRDRFNEVHLTSSNFSTVVGFDQFCKDAINYAYHDILNAEMEWPFLHTTVTQKTTPGTQFYSYSPSSLPYTIKEVDWGSFYLSPNSAILPVTAETHTVPSSSPYVVTPTNLSIWKSDRGVVYAIGGTALTPVMGDPLGSQYTIVQGQYYFSSFEAGLGVRISYYTSSLPIVASLEQALQLKYIDYDFWREVYLQRDLNTLTYSQYGIPRSVFKTQNQGEFGITPVPDKIYTVNFEAWLDGSDLSGTTDVPLLPTRYNQIILDGAQKYCYEFREDPQSAQMADARFKAGIARMRIELINRDITMQGGMYWYRKGFNNTLSSI